MYEGKANTVSILDDNDSAKRNRTFHGNIQPEIVIVVIDFGAIYCSSGVF